MKPIPLPSHIHYELILQMLERQSLWVANHNPAVRDQLKEIIITLRKAFSQQKQLEKSCEQSRLPYEYRWSINHVDDKSPVVIPPSNNVIPKTKIAGQ